MTLDTQILDVVRKSVSLEVVRALLNTFRQAGRLERTMLSGAGAADEKSKRDSLSFADPEILDQLVTACHQDLGKEGALMLILISPTCSNRAPT